MKAGVRCLAGALMWGVVWCVRGSSLYGVHWWGHTYGQPVDPTPAQMLQSVTRGGWCVETVLTHPSVDWWYTWYFEPLIATLATQYNITVITRIDYTWGETIPAPSSPGHSNWAMHVCGVMSALREYCNIFVLGNEPNLHGECRNWPGEQIAPEAYAQMYRSVRAAIPSLVPASPRGPYRLLIAGVSPGPVQPGVRWMSGTNWLERVLMAIPTNEVDGVAIHAYGGSVASFHQDYVDQLQVLARRGLRHVPVYMTEFNKYATPGDAGQESIAADFVRGAYRDIHAWNTTGANHNIICACWFVYDCNQQGGSEWYGYSIEYWKDHGWPRGNPGDLYSAFTNIVSYGFPAGVVGTVPEGAVGWGRVLLIMIGVKSAWRDRFI